MVELVAGSVVFVPLQLDINNGLKPRNLLKKESKKNSVTFLSTKLNSIKFNAISNYLPDYCVIGIEIFLCPWRLICQQCCDMNNQHASKNSTENGKPSIDLFV